MKARRVSLVFMVAVGLAVMAPIPASAAFIPFEVGGSVTEASIQPTVDGFRAALGDPNNANLPGPRGEGRREINWDGGGAVETAPAPTPFTGFQNTRGALFTTPGTEFAQVPVDLVDELFNNPTYAGEFNAFSEVRLFTPVGSNITDVTFFIPGTGGTEPATVSGFGAVFTDVDAATSTQLEFFNASGDLLFSRFALPGTSPSESLSFLGAVATAGERIARVRITAGAVPGPNESATTDIVMIDDVLYTEPRSAVPEPGTLVLLVTGTVGVVTLARVGRRR